MARNITVTFDDGTSHVYQNAPDNLTPEQVTARAQQDFGKTVTALDGGKGAAPQPKNDSFLTGVVAGALKPIDNMAEAASHIPVIGPAIDKLGQKMGLPSTAQTVAQDDAARANNMSRAGQITGNVLGTIATAPSKGGVLLQGAASGALLSDSKNPLGVIEDALVGAGTSLGTNAMLKGAAKALSPTVSKAARALNDAGIMLSLGQILEASGSKIGKAVRTAEDKLRSAPVLGAVISGSRDRATDQLNQAVGNDALATIGKKLPEAVQAGHDLMDNVEQQLSSQYQKVVPKLVGHLDQQFVQDLGQAKALTNSLPDNRQAQFANIVHDVFGNRINNGVISGQDLKDAESRLTLLISRNAKSPDADQKGLAEALGSVRQALRDMAVRSDPSGSELQAINTGWAKLKQMQAAANVNGVILPTALARAANKSGQGTQLARAAALILPDHVPNSGTADRAALLKMGKELLGGLGGGGAMVATGHVPALLGTLAAGAAASAPYTAFGQRAVNSFAFRHPGPVEQQAAAVMNALAARLPGYVPALVHGARK